MQNGIYSLSFQSSFGQDGAGSAELRNGHLRGGDDEYLYIGTYVAQGETIRAKILVRHFQGDTESIFGQLESFTLEMIGRHTESTFFATGIVQERHGLSMTVEGGLIEGLGNGAQGIADDADYSRLTSLIEGTPQLAELRNFSQLARVDIEACLTKLRKVGEKLARVTLSTVRHVPTVPDFNRVIRALQDHRVLSRRAIGYLHIIRINGNVAAHPSEETLITNDDLHLAASAFISVVNEMLDRGVI